MTKRLNYKKTKWQKEAWPACCIWQGPTDQTSLRHFQDQRLCKDNALQKEGLDLTYSCYWKQKLTNSFIWKPDPRHKSLKKTFAHLTNASLKYLSVTASELIFSCTKYGQKIINPGCKVRVNVIWKQILWAGFDWDSHIDGEILIAIVTNMTVKDNFYLLVS